VICASPGARRRLGVVLAMVLSVLCATGRAGADPTTPIPSAYFGMHVLNFSRLMPEFRVGALRTWDAWPGMGWTDINQAPGHYDWRYFESYLRRVQPLGADIVFVFGRTPRWASARPDRAGPYGPGQCAPPADLGHWDDFVRATVQRAAGRIRLWEIWNEPQDPHYYCGDVATMVAMARRAYAIIKAADPGAQVISPSTTGWGTGPGARWLTAFLAQGGGDHADIIGFHGYGDTVPERVVGVIAEVRRVLAQHGQAHKPLWNTEASWAGSRGTAPSDLRLRAAFLARSYLLQWPLGIARFYWYAYDGGRWGGLRDGAGGLAPDGIAYRTIYEWLVGATADGPCSRSGAVWRCTLTRPGGYRALAVWSTAGDASFAVPRDYVRYRDLTGATHPIEGDAVRIGTMPLLLEAGVPPLH
jgi:hypothetical protein